jgi:hypothetical protein
MEGCRRVPDKYKSAAVTSLGTLPINLLQRAYGAITMGARQKANFPAAGSSTLTWQVYLPG